MFNERKKPLLFTIVPIFIGFVFIVIVCYWVFIGVMSYKVAKKIEKDGLKSIVTTIWEGTPKEIKDGVKDQLK